MSARRRAPRGRALRLPRLRWADLLPEARRSWTSLALAFLLLLPVFALGEDNLAGQDGDRLTTDLTFVVMAAYLVAYVLLTSLVFTRASWAQLERWAHRSHPRHWAVDLFLSARPGPGTAAMVSVIALTAAVVWLPRQRGGEGLLPEPVMVWLAVVLLVGSWATVALTFSIAYLLADVRSERHAFAFPGRGRPGLADYVYLSLTLSTSLGSSDVQVLDTSTRRLVATHSVLAFVFNAVILAAVVSVLVSSRS